MASRRKSLRWSGLSVVVHSGLRFESDSFFYPWISMCRKWHIDALSVRQTREFVFDLGRLLSDRPQVMRLIRSSLESDICLMVAQLEALRQVQSNLASLERDPRIFFYPSVCLSLSLSLGLSIWVPRKRGKKESSSLPIGQLEWCNSEEISRFSVY